MQLLFPSVRNEKRRLDGCELVFNDISVKIGNEHILKNINGCAKPGELLAVMGPSGRLKPQ